MTTQTSVNNLFSNNDVEVKRDEVGDDVELEIINSNNSSTSSRAFLKIETGGASGGDPSIIYSTTANSFSMGIDNSDSDSLVISESSSLGTDNIARCDTSGLWTYPSNSCFHVNLNDVDQLNVVGIGNVYKIPFSTVVFNINSDFSTVNKNYVCPKDGVYSFSAAVGAFGNSTGTLTYVYIYINSLKFKYGLQSHDSSSRNMAANVDIIASLDEGDVVDCRLQGYSGSGLTTDLYGDIRQTFFSGALIS